MESFTPVLPKWDAAKISTFRAVKSGIGMSNTTREDWCSVKLLTGVNKLFEITQKSKRVMRSKFDPSYIIISKTAEYYLRCLESEAIVLRERSQVYFKKSHILDHHLDKHKLH